jgi:formylmethanofuran dehydrogenase subunit E
MRPPPAEILERCVAFHGHLCPGQALGVRLALKGMDLLGTDDPRGMIVFIENDRCIADAVQIATGTRIGRRSAKLVNLGKMAVTFVRLASGAAWRVNVRRFPAEAGDDRQVCRAILDADEADLLAWRRVRVSLRPEDLPGKPKRTANCARCGEKVFDGREAQGPGGPLCLSCAGGLRYYEPEAGEACD